MSDATPWKGKFKIYVRAFAPFKVFGNILPEPQGYHGDDRGYSNDENATARLHHIIEIDSPSNTIKNTRNLCSKTLRMRDSKGRTAMPERKLWKAGTIKSNKNYKRFHFTSHIYAGNPVPPRGVPKDIVPNIDIFTDITITQTKKLNGEVTLLVSGKLTGDNFPCTEVFITDAKGTSVFLGVGQLQYGVDKDIGPITELPGENTRPICTFNVNIPMDKDGNFYGDFSTHNKKYKTKPIQRTELTADEKERAAIMAEAIRRRNQQLNLL